MTSARYFPSFAGHQCPPGAWWHQLQFWWAYIGGSRPQIVLLSMGHKVTCRLCKREKVGDQGQCLGGRQKSLYIVQSVYLRGLLPESDRRESLQSTTEFYFSLQSGGVSGEDVGGELYRRPLRSPEVWHLSVGPYQGRLQGLVQWESML